MGSFQMCPTVLRTCGFQVHIFLPPREHGPAHVHVVRDEGSVVVMLPVGGAPVRVRSVRGMRDADVIAAVRLVAAHAELLLASWRKYHGETLPE
jgi:hypothetical protein